VVALLEAVRRTHELDPEGLEPDRLRYFLDSQWTKMSKMDRLQATRRPFVVKKSCNVLPRELPAGVTVQDFFDGKALPGKPNVLASDVLEELQREEHLTVQVQGTYSKHDPSEPTIALCRYHKEALEPRRS
jgi:hypothetical protein